MPDNEYYLNLLMKYMRHVREAEGIDFTDRTNDRTSSDVEFTQDEQMTLNNLSLLTRNG